MCETITEALVKSDEHDLDIRVTCGYRWLCRDGVEWVVYERKPYQKKTRIIIRAFEEKVAVHHLIK